MKETIWEYFHFTRSERKGIFILLLLMVILIIFPNFYQYQSAPKSIDYSHLQSEIEQWNAQKITKDSIIESVDSIVNNKQYDKPNSIKIKGFPFNPNTINEQEWLALGIPEKVVKTILNYKNKGGRFYKKEDLKKIYGFKTEWYDELKEFINIDNNNNNNNNNNVPKSYDTYPKQTNKQIEKVDINTASAEDFQTLRGIGPAYSKRIVKFREALGGFVKVEQVSETYGLPDSTFQNILNRLELSDYNIQYILINEADIETLKSHPYISYKKAQAIIKYREQHGAFNNINELENIKALSNDDFKKISPYLKL